MRSVNDDLVNGDDDLVRRAGRLFDPDPAASTRTATWSRYVPRKVTPVVVEALNQWLQQGPGELDHHNLTVLAAAVRRNVITDPGDIAQLINGIPVTGIDIAVQPIDIERHGEDLDSILQRYSVAARKNLISDLIRYSAVETLKLVPPGRMTDAAEQLLSNEVKRVAKGPVRELLQVFGWASNTAERNDVVLSELERRLGRIQVRGEAKPSAEVTIPAWDSWASEGSGATPDNWKRLWVLTRQLDLSDEMNSMRILGAAVRRPELAGVADQILDLIDTIDDESARHNLADSLLVHPDLPEEVAKRAVYSGAKSVEILSASELPGDHRLAVLRLATYAYSSDLDETLPSNMSPDEIDQRLAASPVVSANAISQVSSSDALGALCRRAGEFDEKVLRALLRNPATVAQDALDAINASSIEVAHKSGLRAGVMLTDSRMSSDEARRILDDLLPEQRLDAIKFLAGDFTKVRGDGVSGVVLSTVQRELHAAPSKSALRSDWRLCLRAIAGVATSRDDQVQIAEMSSLVPEAALSSALLDNATLRADIAQGLRLPDGYPAMAHYAERGLIPNTSSTTYSPGDIADLVMAGEANELAVEALISGTHGSEAQLMQARLSDAFGVPSLPSDQNACVKAVERLIDNDALTQAQWVDLVTGTDGEVVIRFLTNPKCDPSMTTLDVPATYMVDETLAAARAIERGEAVGISWPDAKKVALRWADLPNFHRPPSEAAAHQPPDLSESGRRPSKDEINELMGGVEQFLNGLDADTASPTDERTADKDIESDPKVEHSQSDQERADTSQSDADEASPVRKAPRRNGQLSLTVSNGAGDNEQTERLAPPSVLGTPVPDEKKQPSIDDPGQAEMDRAVTDPQTPTTAEPEDPNNGIQLG